MNSSDRPGMKYVLSRRHRYRSDILEHAIASIRELDTDHDWCVEITEQKPHRSAKQRNALFGVAYKTIMDEIGLSGSREKDQLHTMFCGGFFGWKDKPLLGRVPVRTTTTNEDGKRDEIDVQTALEFYAFVQRTVAEELGLYVPDPTQGDY